MSDFRAKQRKFRREERERAESMRYYEEHKEEINVFKEASAVAARLQRIGVRLGVDDVLTRVSSRAELHFWYRWCDKI